SQCLEPDEQAAQTGLGGSFGDIAAKDRVNGCRALKKAAHAAHAREQRFCKTAIAKQMIVEEIQMTPGQALDFGQRVVDALGVERTGACGERGLVTEVVALPT